MNGSPMGRRSFRQKWPNGCRTASIRGPARTGDPAGMVIQQAGFFLGSRTLWCKSDLLHPAAAEAAIRIIRQTGIHMRKRFLASAACATLCLTLSQQATHAATLDDGMARLDKIEKENAELRQKVRSLSAAKPVAAAPAPVATDPSKFKGN